MFTGWVDVCTNIEMPIQRQLPVESALFYMYKINMVYGLVGIQDSIRPTNFHIAVSANSVCYARW